MNIIYEDRHILICEKPVGIPSEDTDRPGMPSLIGEYLGGGYVGLVHRLDIGVGGAMVFAKTPKAAAKLSSDIQNRKMSKEYLAVVRGELTPESGEMRDFLFRDKSRNKTFVVDHIRKGVKEALLSYSVLETSVHNGIPLSLVKVRLHTGRSHQIRVQMSSRKHPILGDGRYGGGSGDIALRSYSLTFGHPADGKEISAVSPPPDAFPWNIWNCLK